MNAPCLPTSTTLPEDRARVPAPRAAVQRNIVHADFRVTARVRMRVAVFVRAVVELQVVEPCGEVVVRLRR